MPASFEYDNPNAKLEGDENEFALGINKPKMGYGSAKPEPDANDDEQGSGFDVTYLRISALEFALKTHAGQEPEKIEAQAARNLVFLTSGKFKAE